jgi:glycogen debranching enzyme
MQKQIHLLIFIIFIISNSFAQEKGLYFSKKEYKPENLPEYQSVKDQIPIPILDENQAWLDMYWKSWEIAFRGMKQPPDGSPLVSNWLDEAFSEQIFQWDTIFMMMFAGYIHNIFPAIESLDNFYAMQLESGLIGREYREKDGKLIHFDFDGGLFSDKGYKNIINPPLFVWAEMENFKITGDNTRLRQILPVLEKYAEWLHQPGNPDAIDWEKNGRWSKNSSHQLFWNTPLGSGMDNTPRPAESGFGWVEMSSQMVIMYNNLAELCKYIEEKEKEKLYRAKASAISININEWCWNEEDGFYYDVYPDGRHFRKKTSGGFWPLLAGVATKKQASKLVSHLKNPDEFWRPIVFPTLAADEEEYHETGDYWKGGVWAPTNVMVIKGLEKYGYHHFASEATEKYLTGMYEVYKNTGTLWENYAPEKFEPGNPAKSDFVGWTGCGPIQLLIENVIGLQFNRFESEIHWYLSRDDEHGIKNFMFGDDPVTLICDEKEDNKPRNIFIKTSHKIHLKIFNDRKSKTYNLDIGENRIKF